jgi:hypothetical protein
MDCSEKPYCEEMKLKAALTRQPGSRKTLPQFEGVNEAARRRPSPAIEQVNPCEIAWGLRLDKERRGMSEPGMYTYLLYSQ